MDFLQRLNMTDMANLHNSSDRLAEAAIRTVHSPVKNLRNLLLPVPWTLFHAEME